jgi:hypothetical protein
MRMDPNGGGKFIFQHAMVHRTMARFTDIRQQNAIITVAGYGEADGIASPLGRQMRAGSGIS